MQLYVELPSGTNPIQPSSYKLHYQYMYNESTAGADASVETSKLKDMKLCVANNN